MASETRILETKIAGVINGVQCKCSGTGCNPVGTGGSHATLHFDVWPGTTPLAYNRTWKCGNHASLAVPERPGGPDNPFAQMLADGAVIYRDDEQAYHGHEGIILACSRVFWREPLVQVFESARMGRYDGPGNITKVLPHTETIRQTRPGKAIGECERQMMTGGGDLIDVRCRTTYTYPERYELPAPIVLHYDGNMVWKEEELTLTIDTQATFSWLNH